ncbi:MAG: tRNA methyl transferase PRC-barrel domain-containing protein, partial [Actinomycetota bacterium]
FVRGGDVGAYVDERFAETAGSGDIHDGSGRKVGRHRGIAHYTIGQRKGLGLALGAPVYVTGIDADTNSIRVGPREELGVSSLVTEETSFVDAPPQAEVDVLVQHRAHGVVSGGRLRRAPGDRWEVAFEHPVEAIAPGQSAAFYSSGDPDLLVGGGIIAATTRATAVA